MSTTASINAFSAFLVVEVAAQRGAERRPLLEVAGLAGGGPPAFDDRVPLARYFAVWSAARTATDPGLAVAVGSALDLADYDIFGFLLMASSTLREAFDHSARARSLWSTGGGRWERSDDARHLVFHPWTQGGGGAGRTAAIEATMVEMIHQARALAGRAFAVERVRFAHPAPAPASAAALERFFGVAPTFGAALYDILLPAQAPDWPVVTAHPKLVRYFDRQCAEALAAFGGDGPWTCAVRARLARSMDGSAVTMAAVARAVGTSPRTLHRHLAEEGATFAGVLDEIRAEVARRYLARGSLATAEVAYLVGFRSQSAFFRAFRRWTGETPGAFAARARGDADAAPRR